MGPCGSPRAHTCSLWTPVKDYGHFPFTQNFREHKRMELVSNGTRSSLDGPFHGRFRKFLVNGKRKRSTPIKLKLVTFSPALSRVNCQLPLFTLSSDWFLGLSVCKCSLVIGQHYTFGGLAFLVSLEITHIYPAQIAVVVYIQDRGFELCR